MTSSALREAAPARRGWTQSHTEAAYERLKAMIISGEFHPGEQVDSARIAADLSLGRTPVREALLRLQTEGIVEIIPKRGVRIVPLSADELLEIYQVISAVEVEVVRLLVATRPSRSKMSGLAEAIDRMAAAVGGDDREGWAIANESFHRRLLDLSPNQRLRAVGIAHRDLAQRSHFVASRLLTNEQRRRSVEEHRELLQLIATGDVNAAVASHRDQRRRGAQMLVGALRAHRLTRV